ncbi:MAG TPA: DnaD domain protein [Dehalococcoidia bacterium]|nr:DnaD domain protein [Dehalococcoidia bacterium]
MTAIPFKGFPPKMQFTPLPSLFFSQLLPQMADMAELKVVLHTFWLLYRKRGYPRFVTYGELASDRVLMSGLAELGDAAEALARGLAGAVARGVLLHLLLEGDGGREDLYFINTPSDQRAVALIQSGRLSVGALPRGEIQAPAAAPDIFRLYEENVGMLTPLIAEELQQAERDYPFSWIQDAFREAVALNKRSWRYISRILERWASQGKDGASGGELR